MDGVGVENGREGMVAVVQRETRKEKDRGNRRMNKTKCVNQRLWLKLKISETKYVSSYV